MGDEGGVAGFVRALRRPKVLRTCRACGFSWKVPRYFASSQTQGELRAKASSPLSGRRGREAAARRAEEVAKVSAAYEHCPRCGQETFSARRLWTQTREAYLGIERY